MVGVAGEGGREFCCDFAIWRRDTLCMCLCGGVCEEHRWPKDNNNNNTITKAKGVIN